MNQTRCVLIYFIVHAGALLAQLPDDPFFDDEYKETATVKSLFKEPPNELNFADYRYLGTHNSHVYYRFFENVNQQDHHLLWQLAQGARGLMLDTYDWNNLSWPNARRGDGEVVLSHGQPGNLFTRIQKGHSSYQTLKWELRRVLEWMKLHPLAVITIILEDYANPTKTAAEIEAVLREANFDPLLRPQDWPQDSSHLQEWPSLGWMRAHNKRLVVFTQRAPTSHVSWNQFRYTFENSYSTTNKDALCRERSESQRQSAKPRSLVIFNHFDGLALTESADAISWMVSYATTKDRALHCQQQRFASGRLFNGYFVNRLVDTTNSLKNKRIRSAFDYVNELNLRTSKER